MRHQEKIRAGIPIRAILLSAALASLAGCGTMQTPKIEAKQVQPLYEHQLEDAGDAFLVTVRSAFGKESTEKPGKVEIVKDGEAYTAEIEYGGAASEIPAEVHRVRSLSASYDGTVYYGETVDPARASVYAIYDDDTECRAEILRVDAAKPVTEETEIRVETAWGDASFTVIPVKPSAIRVSTDAVLYEGDLISKDQFRAELVYEDGRRVPFDGFTIDREGETAREDVTVKASSPFGEDTAEITPVKVALVRPEYGKTPIAGGIADIVRITVVYEDGTVVRIPREEAEFTTDPSRVLVRGDNEFRLLINGVLHAFTVSAKAGTNVEDAVKYFAEEMETSDYVHVSDSIFVTVNRIETAYYNCLLTHVVINDPSQLKSEMSHDTYGGTREKPTDAARRLGWVVGVNGSNFDYATGQPTYAGAVIKDSMVMEGTRTDGMEICLMSNGVLFSPEPGVDPHRLVASDVTDSWSCGDTLLINDGQAVNVGIQSEQYRYPRTAVGMVQPCEYYLITAWRGDAAGGMSYDDVRDMLMSHGCSFGKCMDGGGSAALVFEGKLLNEPADSAERAVCDFLYFTE